MEYLLARLRDAQPGLARNVAPPELHVANGALFALTRMRLVSDTDSAAWREAILKELKRVTAVIEDESRHPAPAPTPAAPPLDRPSAEEALERQLVKVDQRRQAAAMFGRKLRPWDNPARDGAHELVTALAELGLISELDERQWVKRIEQVADPDSEPLRTYTTEALEAIAVETHVAEFFKQREAPLVHPRPMCSFEQLVDVLVVRPAMDSDARLESISLYSDGFVIAWSSSPTTHESVGPMRLSASATDDLGTYYFPGGGGSWSSQHRTVSHYRFAPALLPEAQELRIRINEERLIVPLRPATAGGDLQSRE